MSSLLSRNLTYMNIYNPRQRMLRISTALYCYAEYGLGLLNADVQVAMVIGHHPSCAPLVHVTLSVLQPLHGLMPPNAPSFFE